ncbi:hypothetical protein CMO89_00095 [Candidatus Woesearchaeota archaeon]|nr:hypothetical protein [Candidatus Woesearchaeota archaeon]
MNVDIKDKKENQLLHRTEVRAELVYSGKTPSKEEVKKFISGKLSSDPELTVVKKVETVFGLEKANVLVYVYKGKEKLKKVEPKPGKKKKGEKPKAKEEKKKPEEKKEEKKEAGEEKEKKEDKAEEKGKEPEKKEEVKEEKKEGPKEEGK